MKLLTANQLKQLDSDTIKNEPIESIDLMERAAKACVKRIVKLVAPDEVILVFCGKGNNGGDGLAICRLLLDLGFDCKAYVINYTDKFSTDAQLNFNRLTEKFPSTIKQINSIEELKETIKKNSCCIDSLLGTGINKAASGFLADTIDFLNFVFTKIISIDVPSGLLINSSSKDSESIIRATICLTFQTPKLAFLMPENNVYVNEFELVDIGLNQESLDATFTNNRYLTKHDVVSLFKSRNKFSHKGSYGHALLLAGSNGKNGAAIISAKAALRSGAGRLTVHSTQATIKALLNHLPEAMSSEDSNPNYITELDKPENYDAIAFGPGVGLHADTQQALKKLLNYYAGKLIIDADGLNILSENKTWLNFLPANCILTPHPKEFERLCGKSENDFERLETLRQFSMRYHCIVLLKGAHTAIAMPDGTVFFNSSGNAGLAKAGSGDGLTGIILGLLSRGYNPPQASIIGAFIHGYAADLCVKKQSMEGLLMSDVIKKLPKAFKKLEEKKEAV
jgi:ADP-dependent NAD(P)H-hydrate dehydratase / NAD(P)H-hydrate epimerase